jgi:integrase
MSILDECPKLGDFVFTTLGTRPISGWSKAKTALDRLALDKLREIATERGDDAPTTFVDWRLHDLRRTAATNLAKLGVDRIVISKLLNHAEGGVTGIYDRHARDPEKRAAMERWGQRLQEIVDGAGGDNVVQFAASA